MQFFKVKLRPTLNTWIQANDRYHRMVHSASGFYRRPGTEALGQVEGVSLRGVPWEQIRWVKAKAALTLGWSRLG